MLAARPKSVIYIGRPVPTEGRAHVTNAGRDAVDAAARETNAVCWRTAKSCGSDAPGLASSLREEAQMTVATKPGHRGEREVSRKTIARGMPGRSGVTVVTMLVCFVLFRTRGCGCIERPAFPAPSEFKGERFMHGSGGSRREIAKACVIVIARSPCDEAIQLSLRLDGLLRRFRLRSMSFGGQSLLAMTAEKARYTLTRHRPRRRTIQYSRAGVMKSRTRGVLDTPHARGMTTRCGAAVIPLRSHASHARQS